MTSHARATAALRAFAATEPVELTVAGHCMEPLIPHGARITIRRRAYLPGDVVAFRRADGRLLVHRVLGFYVGRRGATVVAQGDRLSREDEPVPLDRVLGRVLACDGRPLAVTTAQRLRSARRFARALLRRSARRWLSATAS